MLGIRKNIKREKDLVCQYIEEFQQRGLLKDGKISILRKTTGFEKSRNDNTKCDVAEFRCGKGTEIYSLIIEHLNDGQSEIRLVGDIDFAIRLGGGRFWYVDEYLKSYEYMGSIRE